MNFMGIDIGTTSVKTAVFNETLEQKMSLTADYTLDAHGDIVEFDGEKYFRNYNLPNSIGKVKAFYGNFGVLVKAYAYILMMGDNLRKASGDAVLNANYLKEKLNLSDRKIYFEEEKHEN